MRQSSLACGSANSFDWQGGIAGLLGDKPILLFEDGEGGSIKIEPAERRARDPAVRPLRSILVEDVEGHEFRPGSGFPGHFGLPWRAAGICDHAPGASYGVRDRHWMRMRTDPMHKRRVRKHVAVADEIRWLAGLQPPACRAR